VTKAIKELEKYGYLEVERTTGDVSKYYLKVLV
jgi:DNA-binding MarR family transcriptional regulator